MAINTLPVMPVTNRVGSDHAVSTVPCNTADATTVLGQREGGVSAESPGVRSGNAGVQLTTWESEELEVNASRRTRPRGRGDGVA